MHGANRKKKKPRKFAPRRMSLISINRQRHLFPPASGIGKLNALAEIQVAIVVGRDAGVKDSAQIIPSRGGVPGCFDAQSSQLRRKRGRPGVFLELHAYTSTPKPDKHNAVANGAIVGMGLYLLVD